MPIKLVAPADSIFSKMEKLRWTIKRDEGLTYPEIAELLQCNLRLVQNLGLRNRWAIQCYNPETRRIVQVVVHPDTLAAHRKNKK